MGKLIDYPCKYSVFTGLLTVDPEPLGLRVPDLYQKAEDMVTQVLAQKEAHGSVPVLPIDTIVLAENLGASVIFDTSPTGPRKKEDVLTSTAEILERPAADPETGRLAEVMKAIRLLDDRGEIPVFSIHGLFDTLNFLIDIQKVVMDFSLDPALCQQVADRIRSDILKVCQAAEAAGARVIMYEDGSGSLRLLGPKFSKRMVKVFLDPMMRDFDAGLKPDTVIQLCPKTSFVLTGCDKMEFMNKDAVAPGRSWLENNLEDPEVRFTGALCNRDLHQPAGKKTAFLKLV